jgi:hypothetical protein
LAHAEAQTPQIDDMGYLSDISNIVIAKRGRYDALKVCDFGDFEQFIFNFHFF